MESKTLFDEYEQLIAPTRARFAASPGPQFLESPTADAIQMELFLLYFCAIGYHTTRPVEGWINRSADRCEALGLPELARALHSHARAEAGHDLMMVADVRSLATHWNSRYQSPVNADEFLSLQPTQGALRYCQVHEENIASDSPYAQIAIEYEIELLPLRFGERLIARCVELLGDDILSCLSFLTEHVVLDVGHTKFNERELKKLLAQDPTRLPKLVAAGSAILDAYAQFWGDCIQLAEEHSRLLQRVR